MGRDIQIVQPGDVAQELSRWMKESSLIPILGAGFTCRCPALKGCVPDGKELKEHLIQALMDLKQGDDKEDLQNETLQTIADFYEEHSCNAE